MGGAAQQLMQGGAAFGNLTLTRALRAARAGAAGAADRACWCCTSTCSAATATRRSGRCRPRSAAARARRPGPTRRCATPSRRAGVWRRRGRGGRARTARALESPADPTSSYLARPEWYALPLFQLRMFFEGPLEIVATMVIPGIVTALAVRAAVPRSRRRRNRPRDRRRVLAAGALGLGGARRVLGVTALAKDARDPAYAKARAEEEARAETARRLALKGVPAEAA